MAKQNWVEDFQEKSKEQCKKALDEANRAAFVRELSLRASECLDEFRKPGLWGKYDTVSVLRGAWASGQPLVLDIGASRGNGKAKVKLSSFQAKKAFDDWLVGGRKKIIEQLWSQLQPCMFDLFKKRAMAMDSAQRSFVSELLAASNEPWCQELSLALAKAGKGECELLGFSQRLLSVFQARVAQLSNEGLLPAASEVVLSWGPSPKRMQARYFGATDGMHMAAPKVADVLICKIVCVRSGEASSGGLASLGMKAMGSSADSSECRTEFEYVPSAGPWGMFGCGDLVHSIAVRCLGADALIDKDWSRFMVKLALAHAWALSWAKSQGWDLAQAVEDKMALEIVLQNSSLVLAAKRAGSRL